MAQQKLVIHAKDEDESRIHIAVTIAGRPGLSSAELGIIALELGRKMCDAIRGLHYTDFGPEGTTLTIGK